MKIEDEIQLADVSEIFIEHFYKSLHEFEYDEFVFILIDDGNEVETGVSFVDNLVLFVIEKIAHLGIAGDHQLIHLW